MSGKVPAERMADLRRGSKLPYEVDPGKRHHDMAYWQSSINQLHSQMTMLQHRLAVAIQDLRDFEEATAEVSERSSREPKS
ncbi:hypothetical protein CCM_06498 [Cordyceps militaris CM01]|uniref:Uncharacterized protein n=1 Tax=Cordyceps militaris (strain CM01) TaxID=983644 RepID=G3JMP2_CORMM|nr:uncharacterized protein CCM_06498 [Cordyceps militaris CM01]EGX90078.1 hypothetical protein CCM_06498 [Cordyceps militaris CM01]